MTKETFYLTKSGTSQIKHTEIPDEPYTVVKILRADEGKILTDGTKQKFTAPDNGKVEWQEIDYIADESEE